MSTNFSPLTTDPTLTTNPGGGRSNPSLQKTDGEGFSRALGDSMKPATQPTTADTASPRSALSTHNPARERLLLGLLNEYVERPELLDRRTRQAQALGIANQLGWNASQLEHALGLQDGAVGAMLEADSSLPGLYDPDSGDYGRQLFAATNYPGMPKGLGESLLELPALDLGAQELTTVMHGIASQLGMSDADVDAFYGFERGVTSRAFAAAGLDSLVGTGVKTVSQPGHGFDGHKAGDVIRNWDGSTTVFAQLIDSGGVAGTRYRADGSVYDGGPRTLLDQTIMAARKPWSADARGPGRTVSAQSLLDGAAGLDPQFRPDNYSQLAAYAGSLLARGPADNWMVAKLTPPAGANSLAQADRTSHGEVDPRHGSGREQVMLDRLVSAASKADTLAR